MPDLSAQEFIAKLAVRLEVARYIPGAKPTLKPYRQLGQAEEIIWMVIYSVKTDLRVRHKWQMQKPLDKAKREELRYRFGLKFADYTALHLQQEDFAGLDFVRQAKKQTDEAIEDLMDQYTLA